MLPFEIGGPAAFVNRAKKLLGPSRSETFLTEVPGTGPYIFPKDFYWGSAIAAQHVEDQQPSDWTAFENDAFANGRGGHEPEIGRAKPGHINKITEYSETVRRQKTNFDRMYDQDFALAKKWKFNAFRLSISWSRLFPREEMTEACPDGIAYYRAVLDSMKKNKLEPFVSLFHFESPEWLWQEKGGYKGWERDDSVKHFARFVEAVCKNFGGDITNWCTHNEPNTYFFNGYIDGVFPPLEQRKGVAEIALVIQRLLESHAVAYRIIRADANRRKKPAFIGITQHTRAFEPYRNLNPLDRLASFFADQAFIWDFLDAIKTGTMALTGTTIRKKIDGLAGTQDYVGINYYGRFYMEFDPKNPAKPITHFADPETDKQINDLGWAAYPHGFYNILTEAHRRYKLPIHILENGTCDNDDNDTRRQKFMVQHIKEMWNAMTHGGVDIRSYFHWTFMDNFEWAEGFEARFGLNKVDYNNDFKRIARPSAKIYSDIIKTGGISEELWRNYGRE